jgi:hypothetical protein
VIVPRSEKELRPTSEERTRRLRKHLTQTLRGLRAAKHPERMASFVRPEPIGFVAEDSIFGLSVIMEFLEAAPIIGRPLRARASPGNRPGHEA